MNYLLHRLGLVVVGILIVANLALVPKLVSAAVAGQSDSGQNQSFDSLTQGLSDSPNIVSRVFAGGLNGIGNFSTGVGDTFAGSGRAVAAAGNGLTQFASSTAVFTGHVLRGSTLAVVNSAGNGLLFMARLPGTVFGGVVHAVQLGATIQPGRHASVPVIDESAIVLAAATTPAKPQISLPAAYSLGVVWPIHGAITTLFGVPEPPYQPIHTGLDISDGKRSGITPIHPFKAGTVIQVIHEHIKLGNEVVVDHGGGLTSVYGHMYSTSVQVGQVVNTDSVLGTEGSTGVSTGPHLHFEIRVGGVPKNPLDFIPGRP